MLQFMHPNNPERAQFSIVIFLFVQAKPFFPYLAPFANLDIVRKSLSFCAAKEKEKEERKREGEKKRN